MPTPFALYLLGHSSLTAALVLAMSLANLARPLMIGTVIIMGILGLLATLTRTPPAKAAAGNPGGMDPTTRDAQSNLAT